MELEISLSAVAAAAAFAVLTACGSDKVTGPAPLGKPVVMQVNGVTEPVGLVGMTVAHIGVGLFAIGVTITQSYRIEKDFALQPGESVEMQGYTFHFDSTQQVAGPNYDAVQAHFRITRGDELIADLTPQKRVYRVRTMPMTEAGIEVDWNRDLFVAMGEDLGAGKWSMRLQYKPMVRFIWFGALVMMIGGFIAITDRRYRTRRQEADERLGAGGVAKAT